MQGVLVSFKNSERHKIVFTLDLSAALYSWPGNHINIYGVAFAGAVIGLLWLPMLLLLVLPIVSIIFLMKQKSSFKSLYPYALLFIMLAFLLPAFRKIYLV